MQASAKNICRFWKPILHSRSPQLFNAVFVHENINALYTRIQATNGKEVVDIIKKHKISGANITTPFKETVLEYVDSISDEARQIGGINVIINSNGALSGHNTDHRSYNVIRKYYGLKNSELSRTRCRRSSKSSCFWADTERRKCYSRQQNI